MHLPELIHLILLVSKTLIQGPYLNIFVTGIIFDTCAYCTTSLLIVIYSTFIVGILDRFLGRGREVGGGE